MKKIFISLLFLIASQSTFAQTWSSITTNTTKSLLDIAFVDANNGWVVGNAGTNIGEFGLILKTTNAGTSFASQNTVFYSNYKSISATDVNNAWIADRSLFIKHTNNGGTTWAGQTPGPSPTYPYNLLNDVFFKDANNGWAVGDNGTIYRTNDGGGTWTKQTSGTTYNLQTVFFASTTVGWAAGDNSTMLRTPDGGITWVTVTLSLAVIFQGNRINDMFFLNSNVGWTTISEGAILKTIDGGQTWNTYLLNGGSTIFSIFFTDAYTGWAVGTFGYVGKSTDGGATWTQQTGFNSSQNYTKVFFTDANHGWVCGTGGLLYKYVNGNTCPSTLTPTGTITTNQKAATSVTTIAGTSGAGTLNIIPNAANVVYQAGSFVRLNPGFVANKTSVFTAKILAGCN